MLLIKVLLIKKACNSVAFYTKAVIMCTKIMHIASYTEIQWCAKGIKHFKHAFYTVEIDSFLCFICFLAILFVVWIGLVILSFLNNEAKGCKRFDHKTVVASNSYYAVLKLLNSNSLFSDMEICFSLWNFAENSCVITLLKYRNFT